MIENIKRYFEKTKEMYSHVIKGMMYYGIGICCLVSWKVKCMREWPRH